MSAPAYYYIVRQMPGLALKLALNDVPFYRRAVDLNLATNGPVNHALLPGENTVLMEFLQAPVNPQAPNARVVLDFEVLLFDGDVKIHESKWPQVLDRAKPEDRKLPFIHRDKFDADKGLPLPIWDKAPRETFPSEGTPEMHDAVFELWDAYRRADVGAFLSATEVKLAEHQKYYGAMPELAPAEAARTYGAKLREPWDLQPFVPEELVFERWADGRVAYVTRKDGGHALVATHKTDPKQRWRADLYLTRVDGRWRIFR